MVLDTYLWVWECDWLVGTQFLLVSLSSVGRVELIMEYIVNLIGTAAGFEPQPLVLVSAATDMYYLS